MDEEQVPAVESAEPTATESAPAEQPTEPQAEPQAPAETESNESEPAGPPESVPYARFKEVNDKLKALETQPAAEEEEYVPPQYQPQVPAYQAQQLPVDQNTGEIDPVQYANWVADQAQQRADNSIAWDRAERAHPELSDSSFRKAAMGMIYAESVTSGKVVSPAQAAVALKKLTQGAAKQAVQAQTEQVRIQDSVKPLVGGAQVTETRDPVADLKKVATQSQDLTERTNARMELIKNL